VHSASLELGGAPAECTEVGCRLKRISTLARFAGLYSDGVVVHNFFADHASVTGHPPERDSESFRDRIADDVAVALSVRPLIDAGLIRFFSPSSFQDRYHLCLNCLAKQLFGDSGRGRFRRVYDQLSKTYLDSLQVEAYFDGEYYVFDCNLPKQLHEHGGVVFVSPSADELTMLPRILKRVERGDRIYLSREACKRMGIDRRLDSYPLQNIFYHAAVANTLGTSFFD
jgi:hypothetical protein